MSTPKIIFFIKAVHRGISTGRCRAAGGFTNNCSGYRPGSARARDSAGQQEMLPGKIRENTPVCPAASTPNPNNCSRFPIPKIPIFKRRRCCSEFELHTQRPDGTITRTIYRFNPEARAGDPEVRSRTPNIPNISRWAGGSPTPPKDPAIPLDFRYPLLLGFVRLLWEFLLV